MMSRGINPSGAMDRTTARLINILLGSSDDNGVLELHFPAGEIVFERESIFALGGADFSAELNGVPIGNWRLQRAPKDSVLKFPEKRSGHRLYLGVAGGFDVPRLLGSVSTNLAAHFGGWSGRSLITGDRIPIKQSGHIFPNYRFRQIISPSLIPRYSRFPTVRVIEGAEFHILTDESKSLFYSEDFVVTKNSNRMGYRLSGPELKRRSNVELISSGANFGTVQILPDGQLVVLMADHQTSGGYPRVAHVIGPDLPLLAQFGPNDKIAFHSVKVDDAEAIAATYEAELNLLRIACDYD